MYSMLDMRTTIISYATSNLICAAVIATLWLINRKRFSGIGFWLADFVMQFAGLVLVALRNAIPLFVSAVVGNTLLIGGTLLLLIGLERFTGKRGPHIQNYVLLAAFVGVHWYFISPDHDNLAARNINLSLGIFLLTSQCVWLLLRRVDSNLRPTVYGVNNILALFSLLALARILLEISIGQESDLFNSGPWEVAYILANQMLYILLTFGLFLMVNRRLVFDLENDILERKNTENTLKTSEEKFLKAFHASPDAITISRVRDGQLVEVNEGFTRLSGYSKEEALASSSIKLNLYVNPKDRKNFVSALSHGRSVREYAIDFRTRSGNILNCLLTAETILLGGETHILSVVRDITRQKRTENTMEEQARALTERIKELNCISELSYLIEKKELAPAEILTKSVDLLRLSMQYPKLAGTRLIVEEMKYASNNFQESSNKISTAILAGDDPIGSIDVCYPESTHRGTDARFTGEEKRLLEIVAGKLGRYFERLRIQGALHNSEALYRQMFFNHSAAMLLVDPESGSIVEANPAAAEFYGYSVEAMQQMTIYQINILAQEEIEARMTDTRSRIQNYYSATHRLASGDIRQVEVHSVPVQITGRTLLYSIIHDITERKRLDDALRHQNEVLASLHQVTLDLIKRHDVDDVLQAFLKEISNLLDAPQISIDLIEEKDMLVTRAVTPGQRLQAGDRMVRGEGGWLSWKAIETGEPVALEDYSVWSMRRPLYEDFPIHAIMVIPIHHRDRVIGNINISRNEPNKPFNDTDINVALQLAQMIALVLDNAQLYTQLQHELVERKQAEKALLVSESRLHTALKVGQVGYWDWNLKTNEVTLSDEICQMYGYDPAELTPSLDAITQRIPPEEAGTVHSRMEAAVRGEIPYDLEHRIIRSDGSMIHVHAQAQVTRDKNGKPIRMLGTFHDITVQKQNEENLLKLTALEERQRLARDLHDSVNQSIHSLVLFSDTLGSLIQKNRLERVGQIVEKLQESARQALKETRLMLFELLPSDSGADLDLIQNLQTRLAMVEQRAGIRTELIQEGDIGNCPPRWRADIFLLVIEALNNALKHSQARSVTVEIRCLPEQVEVQVTDNGKGFDPPRTAAGGLGLQSMRERARLMGGDLAIDSSPGKGTRVHFSITTEA